MSHIVLFAALGLFAGGPKRPPQVYEASRTIGALRDAVPLNVLESSESLRALRPTVERTHTFAGARHRVWDRRSNAAHYLNPMFTQGFVLDRGQRLTDTIASFPEERRALGVSGLSYQQIFSGLCEAAAVDVEVTHEGQTYDARFLAEEYAWATSPQPTLYALSSTCTDALLRTGGAVEDAVGAGCSGEDLSAHFPSGSACRLCLDVDGDHARCVARNACKEQMNREMALVVGNQVEYYDVLEAAVLACAPNYVTTMFILANELGPDNEVPAPFDPQAYHSFCWWTWNISAGRVEPSCNEKVGEVNVSVADVTTGRVDYIRPRGDTTSNFYFDRWWFASTVEVEGYSFQSTSMPANTVAQLSVPNAVERGWGYPPNDLRPGGTDRNDPEQTYARDWIAALTLKTATRIDGVLINHYNRNLCSDDLWQGPDEHGRYYCKQPLFEDGGPPDDGLWNYDWGGYIQTFETLRSETYPMLTLASTGLPDPEIPGGYVAHILGSPTLADPEWENCRYPDLFYPDEMSNWESPEALPSITTQTYRFGKDPRFDIRVVLATNTRRAFCSPFPP